MTLFQLIGLLLTAFWLIIVVVRYRRSQIVLIGGLFVVGLFILVSFILKKITAGQLGLGNPGSVWLMLGWAAGGLVVILLYSRPADWLASRWFAQPPTLDAFRVIQQSKTKLLAGILAAWVLGGVLEELIARGLILRSIDLWLSSWMNGPLAAGIAIIVAGIGTGIMHFYQGPRAVAIILQISILFGILFVVSGYDLRTVVICHGLYDTIAFIRFAAKKSKYST